MSSARKKKKKIGEAIVTFSSFVLMTFFVEYLLSPKSFKCWKAFQCQCQKLRVKQKHIKAQIEQRMTL